MTRKELIAVAMSVKTISESTGQIRDRYLELLKRALTNTIYEDPNEAPWGPDGYDATARGEGADWPRTAHTMIGRKRLDNLADCVAAALADGVPGDLIETGVWRGGASILMRGVLAAYGDTTRTVWVADSFDGLPPPDPEQYPADAGDTHHEVAFLAVPLEEVRANFARYDLLDDQVRFLPGWFSDTLPAAPIERLAVLRLDGDMYSSTWDALTALYDKVSPGGFVIVDDYHAVPGCKQAVDDYRTRHGIDAPLETIDWAGVFWRVP
jgi:O-methyltransferase